MSQTLMHCRLFKSSKIHFTRQYVLCKALKGKSNRHSVNTPYNILFKEEDHQPSTSNRRIMRHGEISDCLDLLSVKTNSGRAS